MQVIDIHTHVVPAAWDDIASRFGVADAPSLVHDSNCACSLFVGGKLFRKMRSVVHDPSHRIQELEEHGIGKHLLSPIPKLLWYAGKTDAALYLSQLQNDYIADLVARYPERFFGAGTVPLQNLDLAVGELQRLKHDLGIGCVEIGTNVNEVDLGDSRLAPFFEAVAELDMSVFVHGWDVVGSHRMTRYYFPHLVGIPLENALAAASLIFGGVLERHPKLRICIAHGGGAFAYILGRIMHGYQVRPEAREAVPHPPDHYARKLYFDTITHDAEALAFLLERFGEDRLLFGSDYPFDMGSPYPLDAIEYLRVIPEAARPKIMAQNALRFLGAGREPSSSSGDSRDHLASG